MLTSPALPVKCWIFKSNLSTAGYHCSPRPFFTSIPLHLFFLGLFLFIIWECQILSFLWTDVKMITLYSSQFSCVFNVESRHNCWVGEREKINPAPFSCFSQRSSQSLENELLGSNYDPHLSLDSASCIPIDELVSMLYPQIYLHISIKEHFLKQRQTTPVLLPGKSHGQRSLVGCSP